MAAATAISTLCAAIRASAWLMPFPADASARAIASATAVEYASVYDDALPATQLT